MFVGDFMGYFIDFNLVGKFVNSDEWDIGFMNSLNLVSFGFVLGVRFDDVVKGMGSYGGVLMIDNR